jgi:hypothetical protein
MRLREVRLKQAPSRSVHHLLRGAPGKSFTVIDLEFAHLMARLPRQYAPLVYGIIQAAITTAVATAIATHHLTDFGMRFVEQWLFAWALAFLTMLPLVAFVSPLIQRCVLALTVSHAGDGMN